ncbi:MAG: hypothetical protein CSB33_01680 [Desulfobacterales bacterium]|nr:MAG: hypothetical protein CSB33_01680 [Desulfobacterales bacterium]
MIFSAFRFFLARKAEFETGKKTGGRESRPPVFSDHCSLSAFWNAGAVLLSKTGNETHRSCS